MSGRATVACLRLLSPLTHVKQGEKRKGCHPKSDNRILTSDALLNQKSNKQAMNNKRLLLAAVFHFSTSSGKRQLLKYITS